jgi:hypothetical protein
MSLGLTGKEPGLYHRFHRVPQKPPPMSTAATAVDAALVLRSLLDRPTVEPPSASCPLSGELPYFS